MLTINDRTMLGAVAGLAGNVAKNAVGLVLQDMKLMELGAPTRAAGMFIAPHKVGTPKGRAVGLISDNLIAVVLGVAMVYLLSISGRDKAVLKGMASGQTMWTTLYGVLATMGATKIYPLSPKSHLSAFVSHTFFGLVTALVASELGDRRLFDGSIPLTASPLDRPARLSASRTRTSPSRTSSAQASGRLGAARRGS